MLSLFEDKVVLFYPMPPDFEKSIACREDSQVSPVCPSVTRNMQMNIGQYIYIEH